MKTPLSLNLTKSAATVILDVEVCITKANGQLKSKFFHQSLNEEPTTKHAEIVTMAIKKLRKLDLLTDSTA